MEIISKRVRSANYTANEKKLLLDCVFDFKQIVENRKTDQLTWREKERAWDHITERFNTTSPYQTYRAKVSLKKLYDNLKKDIRKGTLEVQNPKVTVDESEIKNSNHELLLSIMNDKSVNGHDNQFHGGCMENEMLLVEPKLEIEDNEILEDSDNSAPVPDTLECNGTPSLPQKSWSASCRPLVKPLQPIHSVPSNDQCSELSRLKVEIAQQELNKLKAEQNNQAIESALRQQSLQLDIELKKAQLKIFLNKTC